jgi:hypothetical protein
LELALSLSIYLETDENQESLCGDGRSQDLRDPWTSRQQPCRRRRRRSPEVSLTDVFLLHFYPKLDIVSCRTVAKKRQREKQLYNRNFYVKAPQISMFSRQRRYTAIMEEMFSTRSVPRGFNQGQLVAAVTPMWRRV